MPLRSLMLPLAITAAALLAAACAGPSAGSSPAASVPASTGPASTGEARVAVSVADEGCTPASLEAPSGRIVFEVTNAGGDVAEFEILSGDRVMDEVEDIVPGFVVNLVTRLDGGDYQLICYGDQSPRGALTVTGGPASTRPPSSVVDAAVLARYGAT